MDKTFASLVDLVEHLGRDALSPAVTAQVARHTLDTVGCGAGGFASEPARITRDVVRGSGGVLCASVYGEPDRVLVDHVGLANATANRYLDFNDFGVSGHPSDMIPAILAMTEATGSPGSHAVRGVHVAYEVATRLAEAVPADLGWDQGVYCSAGIAAGQSVVLGLDRERTAHALSLAMVPSIPVKATRYGSLSQWKAAATGHAAASATLAVRLAAAGMTGPPEPFEGKDGLLERVWPSFALDVAPVEPAAIERASLKRHPACYWGQVPVDLVLGLRDQAPIDDIESVSVRTCATAWRVIGGGRGDVAEKWRPPTRETADHSMPYLMGVALVDGGLSEAAFTPERLVDPVLLSLMDRITVTERDDLTARATRDTCPTEIVVRLSGGRELTLAADVPRGHHGNPMTDDEVSAKFAGLISRVLDPARGGELADRLWAMGRLDSLDRVSELFRAFRFR